MRKRKPYVRKPTVHELIAQNLAPTGEQTVRSLRRLKSALNCSWWQVASLLGIRQSSMLHWLNEDEARYPVAATAKLIWLLESIALYPERADSWTKIMTWGVVERGWRGGRRRRGDTLKRDSRVNGELVKELAGLTEGWD